MNNLTNIRSRVAQACKKHINYINCFTVSLRCPTPKIECEVNAMLNNSLIFATSALLAVSFFATPTALKSAKGIMRTLYVAGVYFVTFICIFVLYGINAAVAILVLGAVFTAVGEALVLNYRMVHSRNAPKDRRCY